MDLNHEKALPPGEMATSAQLVVSPRAGRLGYELARDVVSDPRLAGLSLQALGALIRIKAMEEAKQPLLKNVNSACRALGVQSRTFHVIIKELNQNDMELPLVYEDEKYLRANPFGKPILASTLRARSEAGKKRQSVPTKSAEPVAKSTKKGKKARSVVYVDGLPGERGATEVGIPEISVAAVQPEPKSTSTALQIPMQFDLLGDFTGIGVDGGEEKEQSASMRREAVPYTKIGNLFNLHCKSSPSVLATTQWSARRKHDVMMRWREKPDLEFWEKFFQNVELSDFLAGRVNQFRAKFDWLMNASNFLKINEGNYTNHGGSNKLFGGGNSNFKVGTYGDHDVGEGMPWSSKPSTDTKGGSGAAGSERPQQ